MCQTHMSNLLEWWVFPMVKHTPITTLISLTWKDAIHISSHTSRIRAGQSNSGGKCSTSSRRWALTIPSTWGAPTVDKTGPPRSRGSMVLQLGEVAWWCVAWASTCAHSSLCVLQCAKTQSTSASDVIRSSPPRELDADIIAYDCSFKSD